MNNNLEKVDGIHARVPKERMREGIRRWWDAYERVPGAPLYRKEFWLMQTTVDRWIAEAGMPTSAFLLREKLRVDRWIAEEGMLPADIPYGELFTFDEQGNFSLGQLGWVEAPFMPRFETEVIEDRGEHEVVRDAAGRHVLFFKGRRTGFMPEYIDHPVKDHRTWEEDVKWRLDPFTPERSADLDERMAQAAAAAGEGRMITQNLIGGYMYLRSLIGPEELLYFFYDQPDLIHECMRTWYELSDAVIARHQEHVTLDEVFLAEDICYNNGSLISPDMMREFLLPYYKELLGNIRARQIDRDRHLYVQIDTDGKAEPVMEFYKEIGMDVMSPFEVASGCDVVAIGRRHPDVALFGGIDKRILAESKEAIDREVERILPVMRERGGYIPTCDHGVPEEVPLDYYRHYRKRCIELGG
jgi:uroporphyrinogen-III decarboxylase